MLSVCLDGTPLLGRRTGIGRYTQHLLEQLAARDDVDAGVTAFTLRGAGGLAAAIPAGVRTRSLPVPARALRYAWSRTELPPVGLLAGRSQVFHGTNFVLPPTGRTGGVVTIHDLAFLVHPDTVDATGRSLVDLVPRSLRRAGAVLTPSQAMADAIGDAYRVPDDKLVVTPLGVTEEWFATSPATPAQLRAWDLPERYLLFVGTREPRKDLATLLAAHARAQRADPDTAPLLLIGPNGWGQRDRPDSDVRPAGYVEQERLPAIVAAAEALVMPSLYEGFGLPALEALATGTRTIVSNAAALLEVTGGRADSFGIGDADALAGLLLPTAGADADVRARRIEWARRWTWAACAAATVDGYRRALP